VTQLHGKHLFVAGGGRGIGAAAALSASRAGASVTVSYVRRADDADALVAKIVAEGGSAASVQADVTSEAALAAAATRAEGRFGPVTSLVISAGVYEGHPLEEMTPEFWDDMMATNLKGTFLALKAFAPQLRRTPGGGAVVIYTSTAGQSGSPGFSCYAASKAAQIVFMKSMALELAPSIRVNCIAPAWTETEMATEKIDAIGRDRVIAGFPLGRIGLPEDVAGATTFLLSDEAKFITGITLTVDGGMGMRG